MALAKHQSQMDSFAVKYIHLSDVELERLLGIYMGKGIVEIDATTRSQAVYDIRRVMEARTRGQAWAWKMNAIFYSSNIATLIPLALQLHSHGWRILVLQGINTTIFSKAKIRVWVMSQKDALIALTCKTPRPAGNNETKVMFSYFGFDDEHNEVRCADLIAVNPVDESGKQFLNAGIEGKRLMVSHADDSKLITDLVLSIEQDYKSLSEGVDVSALAATRTATMHDLQKQLEFRARRVMSRIF